MTLDTAALLTRLTEATGVSGHEIEIAAAVREAFASHVDTLREDALGNLIGYRQGTSGAVTSGAGTSGTGTTSAEISGAGTPGTVTSDAGNPPALSVLLASHQDEIGLMVTAIEEGGFLRITGVGGWDPRVLLAQPVLVHGQAAPLPGVVGSRPPHVLGPEAQKKVIPLDELFIDLGLPEDEIRDRVRVGDVVTMRRRTQKLGGDRWAGKAMDNRASVLAVAVALEALGGRRAAWDVYAVATTQEEIGLKGAATAAWGVQPTIAVALDVTFAKQPGANDVPYKLGGGPVLAFGPNIHPRIFERLCAAADALEMAYQIEPAAGATGTDAWALQVARGGIPTGLVGIPLRYMHSTVETVSLKDIERTGRLIAQFITGLDADFAAGLVEGVDEL